MTLAPRLRIGVVGGDGIGPEVVEASVPLLEAAAAVEGAELEWRSFPWGCDHYKATGRMMPEDAFERLARVDAIFLGAIGRPDVPDHVSVHGLILPIRKRFEQYVNLRPMRLLRGVRGALAGSPDFDMVCVRENSEGEYSGVGGRYDAGTPDERAEQTGVFTRRGIERVARYAFTLARSRPRRLLASATKSNALQHAMVLWDEVVAEVGADFPDVTWRPYHVDALAARMVTHPHTLDVIVGSNLFGDILTDLGAALTGSLGLAPGANLNPERRHPSMFEPIHGSAPDIAGQGIANPVGTVWAGALMLGHLGLERAHDALVGAIEGVLAEGAVRTPDLGGRATTIEMAAAIGERLLVDGAGSGHAVHAHEVGHREREDARGVHQVLDGAPLVGLMGLLQHARAVRHAVLHARDPGHVLVVVRAGARDQRGIPTQHAGDRGAQGLHDGGVREASASAPPPSGRAGRSGSPEPARRCRPGGRRSRCAPPRSPPRSGSAGRTRPCSCRPRTGSGGLRPAARHGAR